MSFNFNRFFLQDVLARRDTGNVIDRDVSPHAFTGLEGDQIESSSSSSSSPAEERDSNQPTVHQWPIDASDCSWSPTNVTLNANNNKLVQLIFELRQAVERQCELQSALLSINVGHWDGDQLYSTSDLTRMQPNIDHVVKQQSPMREAWCDEIGDTDRRTKVKRPAVNSTGKNVSDKRLSETLSQLIEQKNESSLDTSELSEPGQEERKKQSVKSSPSRQTAQLDRPISSSSRHSLALDTPAVRRQSLRRASNASALARLSVIGSSNADLVNTFRLNDRLSKKKERVRVEVRVVFLKIGEIDTLKEYYHADTFIQTKWREPRLDHKTDEEIRRIDLQRCWNPLVIIDNILSESKDQHWISTLRNEKQETFIVERRRLRGIFQETLELNDFPLDVQDLTITLTSERPEKEVLLLADKKERSCINLQSLVDQQEWRLHEHIEVRRSSATQSYTNSAQSHPCISITCRAARRPGYFYWNVFLIMFFITGLSFATFSVPPERPENRLQLSFTLFLTSVAFKFVINQSLPKISYLTYMDKYFLMSLAILCVVSIWHAVAALITTEADLIVDDGWNNPLLLPPDTAFNGSLTRASATCTPTVTNASRVEGNDTVGLINRTLVLIDGSLIGQPNCPTTSESTTPGDASDPDYYKLHGNKRQLMLRIERDVFISFAILYVLAHLTFAFWLYFDGSKRRREMVERDKHFKRSLSEANRR